MRFNITFAAVLVFFVPGTPVLTGICLMFPEQDLRNAHCPASPHATCAIALLRTTWLLRNTRISKVLMFVVRRFIACLRKSYGN